jgi:uncharacterized repeat protein (TIGR01451 family)
MKNGERGWFLFAFYLVIIFFFLVVFSPCGFAAPNESNSNQSPQNQILYASLQENSQTLSFDPNQYSFLVYDPHNSSGSVIQRSMIELGIPNYDVRSGSESVTLDDLNTHDILIVGWNDGGNMGGLSADVIKSGVHGRVILTGQDADYHTANTLSSTPKAKTFLSQAINYILNGSGTGLLALGDYAEGFRWLPDNWGITTTYGLTSELVQSFTPSGLASGIFDGIEPAEMANWGNSYHNTFDTWGLGFTPFELGGTVIDPNSETIVIAAQFNPIGLPLVKSDDVADGACRSPGQDIIYTISWDNTTGQTFSDVSIVDYLPEGVDFKEFVGQNNPALAPADPNIVFDITDANGLDEIELTVGQSVRLYVNKETVDEDIYSFYLEAATSDPNLGWIDNTEYDPNNPGTAEILASPRDEFYDYYGPGYTQQEGLQFSAVSFGNAMQDGNLASSLYTATQPGYVTLTLINYDTNPVTLESIVIRQTDPNDPNNIPGEPNSFNEPPVYPASSSDGLYAEQTHTITWDIGTIAPGTTGSVSFKVQVTTKAAPGINLHNAAEIYTGQTLIARAAVDTPVCCWDTTDPNIIFVDKYATGNNTGTSWTDAYKDLQNALYRAEHSTCEGVNTIYVAQGEYNPGSRVIDCFVLPEGVSVYGGFKSGGCAFEYRNPNVYVTTLTGLIDSTTHNEIVVKMGDETLLSGFTIRDSSASPAGYGVYGTGVDFTILNCSIENNLQYGLYTENCNVTLKWCQVEDNGYNGIHQIGNDNSILVENCQINNNHRYGLLIENSFSIIKNSVICRNGVSDSEYYGIYISSPSDIPQIYNNTVAYNYNAAIAYTDDDPNYVNTPDIQNCIIWYNNEQGDGEQFVGRKPNRHYSCIYDPNYPGGTNETIDSNHNFSHKPDFAYPYSADPNVLINIHLAPDSFCKEKGNPNLSYADQNDIDAEYRVADNYVDVGADEISCSVVYNAFDWNADGIVNYGEINKYSQNWLAHDPNDPAIIDPNNPNYEYVTDPNSPGYIDPNRCENWYSVAYKYNLSTEGDSLYSIDTADLMVLVEDAPWVWVACWRHDIQEMQQMNMIMGGGEQMMSSIPSAFLESSQSAETTMFAIVEPLEVSLTTDVIEPVEIDPAVERANILSLLDDIDEFIDAGGDDAETWKEMKILLEQSLADIEDMINDPNKI